MLLRHIQHISGHSWRCQPSQFFFYKANANRNPVLNKAKHKSMSTNQRRGSDLTKTCVLTVVNTVVQQHRPIHTESISQACLSTSCNKPHTNQLHAGDLSTRQACKDSKLFPCLHFLIILRGVDVFFLEMTYNITNGNNCSSQSQNCPVQTCQSYWVQEDCHKLPCLLVQVFDCESVCSALTHPPGVLRW